MASTTAVRAADFLNTIGVNTHINWQGSGLAYTDQEAVRNSLQYLGIKYVRDGAPVEGWTLPFYQTLAADGIKFDIPVSSGEYNATGDFSTDLSRIDAFARSNPGAVASIEGLNELNTWPVNVNGSNTHDDLSLARVVQQQLYAEVDTYAALKDIPVLNVSTGGLNAQQASVLGNMSSMADAGNWHVYFGYGDQPAANIASGIAAAKSITPSDPVQITESQYYTAIDATEWGSGGVSEPVQAKLDLNLLLDAAKGGAQRTYIYELVDDGLSPADTVEGSFGLYHNDWTPKAAAVAIHNLTTILGETATGATSFTTKPLDISVSGLPSTGNTYLMQKADGTYDLAIWAEPDIWDQDKKSAITVAPTPVTVKLASAFQTIKVYDPLVGTSPIATAQNTAAVTVNVTDHPLIIEMSGAAAVATSVSASAPATLSAGTGADTLVLRISQDAWNGSAQYTVSVDGKQIGGTYTASALHKLGQSDTLTLKGNWAAGTHQFEVKFLNDAWGGTADTDRNLYIESATYNGKAVTGATHTLSDNGSVTTSFTDAGTLTSVSKVVNTASALSGSLGSQSWGELHVSARDWTGAAALVTKTATGLGVQGGRSAAQVDCKPSTGASEHLQLDFTGNVHDATIRLGRMSPTENGTNGPELAHWKAYDATGILVGEGNLDPRKGTAAGGGYDFVINPAKDFSHLDLYALPYPNGTGTGSGDGSDFSVMRVAYHADVLI